MRERNQCSVLSPKVWSFFIFWREEMEKQQNQVIAETEFEQLLKDLPVGILEKAREFKAFCRARKVKTPQQLLQIVFMYCGLDYPLRQVAGNYTLLYEAITDSSIAERLHVCTPWVKSMIAEMLQINHRQLFGKRIIILDASTVESPGATGTDNKLHLAFDLLNLEFVQMKITDVHTGESFRNFSFAEPQRSPEVSRREDWDHSNGGSWLLRSQCYNRAKSSRYRSYC